MSITFTISPLCFTYSLESNVEQTLQAFHQAGVDAVSELAFSGDLYDRYEIRVKNDTHNIARAAILSLELYPFHYDDMFCDFSGKALQLYNQLPLDTALRDRFTANLSKKNTALKSIYDQLRTLCLSLGGSAPLLGEVSGIASLVEQNASLVEENKKLHDSIVLLAREQAIRINKNARRATTLSQAIAKIIDSELHNDLLAFTKKQGHEQPIQLAGVMPPHPYIEPNSFLLLSEKISAQFCNYVSPEYLEELKTNIERNLRSYQNIPQTYLHFFKFLLASHSDKEKVVQKILGNELYDEIKSIIERPDQMSLQEKLHQFNSRPSPMVSVIHDRGLSNEEKEKLLEKLTYLKPTCAREDRQQTDLFNIEILGGEPENTITLSRIWKRSPLQHAVQFGTVSMVRLLLSLGARTETKGEMYSSPTCGDGVTALHIAVLTNDLKKVILLVEMGYANVNAENYKKQTPLFFARSQKIAEYLLSKGAKANHKDANNDTALSYAAKQTQLGVVTALLTHPLTDANPINKQKDTPLHIAAYNGFPSIRDDFAHMRGGDGPSADENEHIVKLIARNMREKNIDLNHVNEKGHTPLHAVMFAGQMEEVVSKISKPDYQNIKNKTRILCTLGADTSLCTSAKTPMDALFRRDVFGEHIEEALREKRAVAETLSRSQASPPQEGTALVACAENGDYVNLQYLLEKSYKVKADLFYIVLSYSCNPYEYESHGKKCLDVLFNFGVDPTQTQLKFENHYATPCYESLQYFQSKVEEYKLKISSKALASTTLFANDKKEAVYETHASLTLDTP